MQVHIIEPTLADQAGHCHGYVESLLQGNCAFHYDLHIWLDRRGHSLYAEECCQIHPYFSKRLRKIQKLMCLHFLIRRQKNIFIPTAGRIDLIYLNWLLGKRSYQGQLFLHFHQFRITDKKITLLKKIAKRHPEFIILTPTQSLLHVFKESGFARCECIPCPGYAPSAKTCSDRHLDKVIYAGAARSDKGFPAVVNFIDYALSQSPNWRFELQTSPPFSGRYDKASEAALARLQKITSPLLVTHQKTLNREAYQQLFTNAVCLLLYDVYSYGDKFSGIALDAFYHGCPVICIDETWVSEVVKRFNAGVVLEDRSPKCVYEAVKTISNEYEWYATNAKQVGDTLLVEHDPTHTLGAIKKYLRQLAT